jgi:phosphatidylglycerophosphatase C
MAETVLTDESQPDASAPVVLFDFDGVLIRGDSYEHFVRRELERSRGRLALTLPVIALALPMLKKRALRRYGRGLMVWCAFAGWTAGRFEAEAREFGRQVARNESLVVADAVEDLQRHLAGGARVVVATQSARAVVRAILNEWGLATVQLVASNPTFGRLGIRSALRVHGEEKVHRLRALGIPPPWELAYSDSLSDLPMLKGARHPCW